VYCACTSWLATDRLYDLVSVSASWDRTLKVWKVESGQELRTLTGHSKGVNGVAVTPNG
jgi:WD40 repeat protein